MTREELIEVMAEALYAVVPVQGYDWDSLPYETRLTYKRDCNEVLLALEASGVRLVPVDPDDNQLAAGMESDAIQHPWQALDVYRRMIAAA